eukprot:6264-Heterococcus_DN1.PRE.3
MSWGCASQLLLPLPLPLHVSAVFEVCSAAWSAWLMALQHEKQMHHASAPTTAKPTPVPTPVPTTAQPTVAPTLTLSRSLVYEALCICCEWLCTSVLRITYRCTSIVCVDTSALTHCLVSLLWSCDSLYIAAAPTTAKPTMAPTAKTTSNPKVRAGEQVEGAGGAVGYINNGDWVRYTVNVQTAGSYAVQYLLAGNPPAPNAQSIYMTLDLAGCAGPQLAPYTTAAFSTG